MPKDQRRGNKEARKPKAVKAAAAALDLPLIKKGAAAPDLPPKRKG